MKHKGNILCIHYYFPPLRSTAVIRNYHFSQAFSKIFPQVHVLTSDNHHRFPSEQRTQSKNITVHDIYTLDYRTAIGKKNKKDAHISMKKKASRLFQYLLKVQKSYPFNLLLGEGNLIYIYNAYKKASKLIKEHDIGVIYSSFAPYADHYVAYLLKKKYPDLRWIADFRDLQIEPIYKNVIWKGLQRKMEKRVLSRADKLVSISESYADQLKIYHNNTRSVMRGVELREEITKYSKFTISYTGSLYFDYRNPNLVLKEITELITFQIIEPQNIQIIYAGRDGAQFAEWIAKHKLESIFIDRGMVTQAEAKEIQDKSHINLLLTSSTPELQGVITGKVFEYFEAANPIICLINGIYDAEFEKLFDQLNAGIVTYDPPLNNDKLKNFILEKYKEVQQTGSVQHIIDKSVLIEEYSWMRQAERLLE